MIVILVKEKMSPTPITIHPNASLAEARACLDQHRIRHLPALEEGRLVGIITDRDIRSAASASSLEQVRVADAMTRKVITVSPETQVQVAAKLMLTHRIGGLPVVKKGELLGIITETDLLNALVEIMDQATIDRISPDYQRRTMMVWMADIEG
ncbi:MAG: CBS domain-containing protein [candidate division NC10 bacterium]|nr:CBS domain-containing protein [candidate division NC10 bacterium]